MITKQHRTADDRERRIIVLYDGMGGPDNNPMTLGFEKWGEFGFDYIDHPDTQIDSIWWDCAYGNYALYPSKILSPFPAGPIRERLDEGADLVEYLVSETRKRGLEVFWSHRIAEVDIDEHGLQMGSKDPVKQRHPDWTLKTWWWQGLWDLTCPELREYKVDILEELATNYDFDGFVIDYARHVPVLPVGRQWELRDHVTEFMRMVRAMLSRRAVERGRPFSLATRIPRSVKAAREDGFDIKTWVEEDLVDILVIGSRSFEPELTEFRDEVGDRVKLYPCMDDHHATDGYRDPGIEVMRGVSANLHAQGANGIVVFNWPMSKEPHEAQPHIKAQPQFEALCEMGTSESLKGKHATFPIERRGGYPWADGAFNRNEHARLPLRLRYDDLPTEVHLRCSGVGGTKARLRIIYFDFLEGDVVEVTVNQRMLSDPLLDYEWKDPQIFSPAAQPASGGKGHYEDIPGQRLVRAEYEVPIDALIAGTNSVAFRVTTRVPYILKRIQIEKIELDIEP